jgi:hypothetical protein
MIRAFFTCVEQLNSYIKYLPSIYNSPKATESTQLAVPYTEAQLAVQLLRMCPMHWQNQYDLNQNTIPQDMHRLLMVLENIEKLSTSSTIPKTPSSGTNGGNANRNSKNRNSSANIIPKKACVEKHCNLCRKHGGVPSTHNTSKCTKYEKDGTLKAEWGKKAPAKTIGKAKTNGLPNLKKATKQFPYLTRQVQKSWCTLNGTFQTKGKGDLQLKFFQYSNSKRVKIQPDVDEYGKGSVEKPMIDLILGTQTMDELGII